MTQLPNVPGCGKGLAQPRSQPAASATDTTLVRALAALLIANSHLEDFYPIRHLAADGLLGDSLFFLLSGLGLVLSDQRVRRSFTAWYGRRLARIVPSVLLVVLLFDFGYRGGWNTWGPGEYLGNFLGAGPYRFVSQILVFYVIYFAVLRVGGARALKWLIALLFVPYLVLPCCGRSPAVYDLFHWFFYFQMMLLGGWLGSGRDRLARGGWKACSLLLALLAGYVGLRWASVSGRLGDWFVLPHVLIVPIGVLLLRVCQAESLKTALRRCPPLAWAIAAVAGITLEIYLAHYQFVTSHTIASLPFPLNVLVFFAASVLLAQMISWAVQAGRSAAAFAGPARRWSIEAEAVAANPRVDRPTVAPGVSPEGA